MDQGFVVFYVGTPGTSGNPTRDNIDWRPASGALPAGACVLLVQDDRGTRLRLHRIPRTEPTDTLENLGHRLMAECAVGDAIEEMADQAAREMGEFA